MQNYYLHSNISNGSALRSLTSYRTQGEGRCVIGARGSQLQLYRLLEDDLSFLNRYTFHARIKRIEVLPSRVHKHDYVWILDDKGRFCCWHPERIDFVNNAIHWDPPEEIDPQEAVFAGTNCQFEENSTVGTIFYTRAHILVLLHFNINEKGVYIDHTNIIKYPLPRSKIRFANWIKHSQSLFLLGLIVEEENGKTALCVYDLEKGLGVCAQSMEWRFQKVNLLQFYSEVAGQILIMTFNEVSLHNYKSNSPLRNYRTRGNYGQGFYLGQGFYGHIGEELIVFSRDQLRTYGQAKSNNHIASFPTVCFTHCQILAQIKNGTAITVETQEGDVYFMNLFEKTYNITRLFATLGPILEINCLQQNNLFAVVTQQSSVFNVSLLQKQYQAQIKQEHRLQSAQIEKMMTISGGIFILICSQTTNDVFRLNRYQQYQYYFQLPQGNILAAEDKFVVYDDSIYQIDYQCFALSPIVQKDILLAQIAGQVIYFLDSQGNLSSFNNQNDDSNVLLNHRQHDYCWGQHKKLNMLLTANLMQQKHIKIVSLDDITQIFIKGHTLVTSLCSISYRKTRYEDDTRILVGYVDGQIHMHSIHNDLLHSVHIFDHYGSAPVSFCPCGEDAVLANYANKQYLITVSKGQYNFSNICFSHSSKFVHLFGYSHKTGNLCLIRNSSQNDGTIFQRLSLNSISNLNKMMNSQTFRITKLSQWVQSVPLLHKLDDRIIIAGSRSLQLIKLQSYKTIRTHHHNLKEVISLQEIKQGIILCGVDQQSHEHIIILSEQFQTICRFELHTKKPLRYLKTADEENQFYLAHDDSLTLYKISSNLQLLAVKGRKIQLQAYQVDICDELILINDPFRSLAILQNKESINIIGTYLPPYKITHCLFIGEDIMYCDERGCITILSGKIENLIESYFKFTKICTFSVGSPISAIYTQGESVYYATDDGQIGVVKQISRDQFDELKKLETESLLEIDQNPRFSYWQWRNRAPAHERIIDGQIFPNNQYFKLNYKQ